MNSPNNKDKKPSIGIITALSKEYAAVSRILENTTEINFAGQGAGHRYLCGEIPTKDQGKHRVVLCLASMGNNIAGIRASLLLNHFPDIKSIIMVGIAGGIPYAEKPDDHVRLGDIVISSEKGVIQYDFDKETITENIDRHPPRPPSASLIEGVRLLEANELLGKKPWFKFIDQALLPVGEQRPSIETDILVSSTNSNQIVQHPQDPKRKNGEPRVFIDPIASANKLLKNPIKRDQLRDKFGVKAIEMEGSGIADATWNYEIGYLVVRGICDYCDSNKGDQWQAYAAAVAAAYTRALLEAMPCVEKETADDSEEQKERNTMVRTILIEAANPVDQPRLRLDQEIRTINNSLNEYHDRFQVVNYGSISPDDLRTDLLKIKPEIVHFCGHGAGLGGLILVNEKGETKLVSTEALANLFELFQNEVKCVILNACFSDIQAKAISPYIDYVIGMRQGIGDEAAIKFSCGFYDALGNGRSFEDAFLFGRNALDLSSIPESQKPVFIKDKVIYDDAYKGLTALKVIREATPKVKEAIFINRYTFQNVCKQIETLENYKSLHELLQEKLQPKFNLIDKEIGDGHQQIDWDIIEVYHSKLRKVIPSVLEAARLAYPHNPDWIREIEDVDRLDCATLKVLAHLNTENLVTQNLLNKALDTLNNLRTRLATIPNQISEDLIKNLGVLPFSVFIGTFKNILDVSRKFITTEEMDELEEGITALNVMSKKLTSLINTHRLWQRIDNKLHSLALFASYSSQHSKLKEIWEKEIKKLIDDLDRDSIITDWTILIKNSSDALTEVFDSTNEPDTINNAIDSCYRECREGLKQIDSDLLALIAVLKKVIHDPLQELVGGYS